MSHADIFIPLASKETGRRRKCFCTREQARSQRCDQARGVVPAKRIKSECSPGCGKPGSPARGKGQEEDSARHAAERVDQRRAVRNRAGDARREVATRLYRGQIEFEPAMLRLTRISRLFDRKLGSPLVRRETDLVRLAFLAPILERNRIGGRKRFLGVNREASRVETVGYQGFPAFGDCRNNLKEPGGCEAGDVWSDRLDRLRNQQSNHAERLEVAPSDHTSTAIRDKLDGTNPSRPGRGRLYQLIEHSCQATIFSVWFPFFSLSCHLVGRRRRKSRPSFFQ